MKAGCSALGLCVIAQGRALAANIAVMGRLQSDLHAGPVGSFSEAVTAQTVASASPAAEPATPAVEPATPEPSPARRSAYPDRVAGHVVACAMPIRPVRALAVHGTLLVLCMLGCGRDRSPVHHEQDEYVADVVAFTGATEREVRDRIAGGEGRMKAEWEAWEKQAAMTPERTKQFYKQTENYIYDLGHWHLWIASKHRSDLALVEDMRTKYRPKNILDFGGGVGLNALPLAHAGFDVTLADLDSPTLRFGQFRAQRHGIPLKLWRSDVEPAPPDRTYDVILVLDVLEHLPADELRAVVDKLIRVKHAGTQIILSAPFGRTDAHPMHLDADAGTEQQIHRLQTELPTG